jgi:hypothetical protein
MSLMSPIAEVKAEVKAETAAANARSGAVAARR